MQRPENHRDGFHRQRANFIPFVYWILSHISISIFTWLITQVLGLGSKEGGKESERRKEKKKSKEKEKNKIQG